MDKISNKLTGDVACLGGSTVEHQPHLLWSRVRFPAGAFAIFFPFLPKLQVFQNIRQRRERNGGETFRPLRGFFSLRFEVQVWGLDYYRKRIGVIGVWEKTEGVKVSQVNLC